MNGIEEIKRKEMITRILKEHGFSEEGDVYTNGNIKVVMCEKAAEFIKSGDSKCVNYRRIIWKLDAKALRKDLRGMR